MTINTITTNPVATTTAANPVVKKVQTPAEQRKAAIKAALVDAGKKLVEAAPIIASFVLPPAIVGTVYMLLNKKPDDSGTDTGTVGQQTGTPDGTSTTGTGGADAGTPTPAAEGLSAEQKIGIGVGVGLIALTVLGIYCKVEALRLKAMRRLQSIHYKFNNSYSAYRSLHNDAPRRASIMESHQKAVRSHTATYYDETLGNQILDAGTLMSKFEGTAYETSANTIYNDMHEKFTTVRHEKETAISALREDHAATELAKEDLDNKFFEGLLRPRIESGELTDWDVRVLKILPRVFAIEALLAPATNLEFLTRLEKLTGIIPSVEAEKLLDQLKAKEISLRTAIITLCLYLD